MRCNLISEGTSLADKKKKKKVQFDFTKEAVDEIDELQKRVGLPTRAETIRHAIAFLRWAVNETRNGGTLGIERNGEIRFQIPFWQQR